MAGAVLALLNRADGSVLAFLTCTDGSVLTYLNCSYGSVLSHLRFPTQSGVTRFPQSWISLLPMHDNYARKAITNRVWNRMHSVRSTVISVFWKVNTQQLYLVTVHHTTWFLPAESRLDYWTTVLLLYWVSIHPRAPNWDPIKFDHQDTIRF